MTLFADPEGRVLGLWKSIGQRDEEEWLRNRGVTISPVSVIGVERGNMRTAEELVGIVTAASQALEGGFVMADPNVARESASQARRAAAEAPEVAREAAALRGAVPASTLETVSESVVRHWGAYEEALARASTREQIRSIHFALMACLNRELATLREHEPQVLPGVLKRWWVEYS